MALIDRELVRERRPSWPRVGLSGLIGLFVVAVLIASLGLAGLLRFGQTGSDAPVDSPIPSLTLYEPHQPILIEGDSGFLGDNASTGIVWGSGSASDPYIIQGWDIQGTAPGLQFLNTTAYFIVRDCYIHCPGFIGIRLSVCVNGTLLNNTCQGNTYGIHLSSSTSNAVVNNSCSANQRGIYLLTSCSNTVMDNICSGNQYGIHLYTSSDNNTIAGNNCSVNSDRGLYVHTSSGNTLTENNCSKNAKHGIYLYRSRNSVLGNNTCDSNGQYGIYLNEICLDNVVSDNSCSKNWYGMYFLSSVCWNQVTRNTLCDNTGYGAYIASGTAVGNRFWNNTFIGNNGATVPHNSSNIQAWDGGSLNWWNSTEGFGNYWNDWTIPDVDPADGIVDVPYLIDGSAGAQDCCPLTAIPEPIPEFGVMSVVVMMILLTVFMFARAAMRRRTR